jgi:hypothetical protein
MDMAGATALLAITVLLILRVAMKRTSVMSPRVIL